ncbi:MAG: DUF4383 domain-containing protein [Actinobacteria bacterium]|nr:DUF4383 domain-containing protein [Actinomycetota bacterium]
MNRTPAQLFALVFGIVYLTVGLVGFAVTGFDSFAGKTFDEELIIFALNPLHNIVHIGLGAVWIGAAAKHATAKSANMLLGVVLLLVFALGMAGVLEFLAIKDAGAADNYLHLATAALALYFGSVGAAGPARTTA